MKFQFWEDELAIHDKLDKHTAYTSFFVLGLVIGAALASVVFAVISFIKL